MITPDLDITISRWARVGVLFGEKPARTTPDLEHLLLDTAGLAPLSPRLFYLAVTWLSEYGNFVARHRLKRLAETELDPRDQPALGVLLALAVKHGASKELLVAAKTCSSATHAHPLFESYRKDTGLSEIARRNACPEGRRWNLWLPDEPPKHDAIRPASWVIEHNPSYRDRIIRKGKATSCAIARVQRETHRSHSI